MICCSLLSTDKNPQTPQLSLQVCPMKKGFWTQMPSLAQVGHLGCSSTQPLDPHQPQDSGHAVCMNLNISALVTSPLRSRSLIEKLLSNLQPQLFFQTAHISVLSVHFLGSPPGSLPTGNLGSGWIFSGVGFTNSFGQQIIRLDSSSSKPQG